MPAYDEASVEVVRWYTRARRFPQLIGRTPDGTRIPGGPYTFTQVIVTAVFLLVAVKTVDWWGPFDLIGNVMTLALATVGVVWGLGRIPVGARNPLSAADGTWRSLAAPRTGRVHGRPIRLRRPSRVRSIVVIHRAPVVPQLSEPACPQLSEPAWPQLPPENASANRGVAPASTDEPEQQPQPAAPARLVPAQLTGVQKLLASAPTRSNRKAA